MSYFIFGTFNTACGREAFLQVKEYAKRRNIYIWFNDEITFYEDINRMLIEQKTEKNIKFAITSVNQLCNSSDVLFPFDKFSNEVLFADESRSFYKKCCRDNMEILFDCLKNLMDLLYISQAAIFVVEGYDDNFLKKECNLDQMKMDLLNQVENKTSIDSCIYQIS